MLPVLWSAAPLHFHSLAKKKSLLSFSHPILQKISNNVIMKFHLDDKFGLDLILQKVKIWHKKLRKQTVCSGLLLDLEKFLCLQNFMKIFDILNF